MIPSTASNARSLPSHQAQVSGPGRPISGSGRRASVVLGIIWLALGARLALAYVGPKLSGDLTIPGLALFVVTAVLASRIYMGVAKPEPTPESDA